MQDLLDNGEIDAYELTSRESEFLWSYNASSTYNSTIYLEFIFDKNTGMQLYSHWEFTIDNSVFYEIILRQKGYLHPSIAPINVSSDSILSSGTTSVTASHTKSTTDSSTDDTGTPPLFISAFGPLMTFTSIMMILLIVRRKR